MIKTAADGEYSFGAELPRVGQAASVTLSYQESGHWDPEAAVLGTPRQPTGPVKGFGESHGNPATPRHGAWSPQEPHG
jgi:hypothetical protein